MRTSASSKSIEGPTGRKHNSSNGDKKSSGAEARSLKPSEEGPWWWGSRNATQLLHERFEGRRLQIRRSIYLALVEAASKEGSPEFVLSQDELESTAGCTGKPLRESLTDLEALGIISIYRPEGMKKKHRYRLLSIGSNSRTFGRNAGSNSRTPIYGKEKELPPQPSLDESREDDPDAEPQKEGGKESHSLSDPEGPELTPAQERIASWFPDREGKRWKPHERSRWAQLISALGGREPTGEELDTMERYRKAPAMSLPGSDRRRKHLATLLQNWAIEMEQAERYANRSGLSVGCNAPLRVNSSSPAKPSPPEPTEPDSQPPHPEVAKQSFRDLSSRL